ncbi:MAG: hypothetical protein RJS97_08680 [Parvibaculaceae bacterium]
MSDAPKIHEFDSLEKLVDRLRDDFASGRLIRPRQFPYRFHDFRRIFKGCSRNVKLIHGSIQEGGS